MKKTILLLIIAFCLGKAAAAPSSSLVGVWVETNGPGAARIAPCTANRQQLCATGLALRKGGEVSETGTALSAIEAKGQNSWRGLYHHGKRKLPAIIRLTGRDQVEMKVCLAFICRTARYTRKR
jgi:uncharacterized protein (DUF2147 family)